MQLGDLNLISSFTGYISISQSSNHARLPRCVWNRDGHHLIASSTHTPKGPETSINNCKHALSSITASRFIAREAILTAELAEASNQLIPEVIADEETLLPDGEEWDAAETLVRRDSQVLPYTNDDLLAKLKMSVARLLCHWHSNRPPRHPKPTQSRTHSFSYIGPCHRRCRPRYSIDITQAFELGCDAVLLNTAVARAQDLKWQHGCAAALAGRLAYTAGRMLRRLVRRLYPLEGKAVELPI